MGCLCGTWGLLLVLGGGVWGLRRVSAAGSFDYEGLRYPTKGFHVMAPAQPQKTWQKPASQLLHRG